MKWMTFLAGLFALSMGLSQVANANLDADHAEGKHKLFERADSNNDGKVTKEEFKAQQEARMNEMFDRIDTNKDGAIDAAERDAAKQKWREHHQKGEHQQKGECKRMPEKT